MNNAKALSGVNFSIKAERVHGLLGENAAGKSTLMKILCGVHTPDKGTIMLRGKPVSFSSPADALKNGIGMVYQHFRLVEELSVLDNILLSLPDRPLKPLKRKQVRKKVDDILKEYGFSIDPARKVQELAIGQKQLVEITRMLFKDVDVLVMDEPTAVLSELEKESLFSVINKLKQRGKSVVFISHHLNEVLALCDDITVLRKGKNSYDAMSADYDKDIILNQMMGGNLSPFSACDYSGTKQEILKVESLSLSIEEHKVLKDLNFTLNSGEITGIAGFAGNGQLQLLESIFSTGLNYSGKISFKGQDIRTWNVGQKRDAGVAYIPEDRLFHASTLTIELMYNLNANRLGVPPFAKGFMIDADKVKRESLGLVSGYDIDTQSVKMPIGMLSGGNIQKAVIAREVNGKPSLLLINEPTRGLDSTAISFTYNVLNGLKSLGGAILIASSNLDELLEICDVVYVIYEGSFVHKSLRGSFSKKIINEHLAGIFEKHDDSYIRKGTKYEA